MECFYINGVGTAGYLGGTPASRGTRMKITDFSFMNKWTNMTEFNQPLDSSVYSRCSSVATMMRTPMAELSEAVEIGLWGCPFDLREPRGGLCGGLGAR